MVGMETPFGYCPKCGEINTNRRIETGPDGSDTLFCVNMHETPNGQQVEYQGKVNPNKTELTEWLDSIDKRKSPTIGELRDKTNHATGVSPSPIVAPGRIKRATIDQLEADRLRKLHQTIDDLGARIRADAERIAELEAQLYPPELEDGCEKG